MSDNNTAQSLKKVEGLNSHSSSTTKLVGPFRKDIPFRGMHFNRPKVETHNNGDTCTIDTFADEMDVNMIVARHLRTGVPLPSELDLSAFGKVQESTDFSVFAEQFSTAQKTFMQLPAVLRAKFDNNAMVFADYLKSASDDDVKKLLVEHKVIEAETPAAGSQIPLEPHKEQGAITPDKNVTDNVSATS